MSDLLQPLKNAGCLIQNGAEIQWEDTIKAARRLNETPHHLELKIIGTPGPEIPEPLAKMLSQQFQDTGLLSLISTLEANQQDTSILEGKRLIDVMQVSINVPQEKWVESPPHIDLNKGDGKHEFNMSFMLSPSLPLDESMAQQWAHDLKERVFRGTQMFNDILLDLDKSELNPHVGLLKKALEAHRFVDAEGPQVNTIKNKH